jgi:DUF1365 family protein
MKSCIYVGRVKHRRYTPRAHQFEYRLFMLYLDLSELPALFSKFWFWSLERPNLAVFKRKDHLGDKQMPLDEAVRELVTQRTGHRPEGPIRLLTHLSYFGFRFNPVSFYYCFNKQDTALDYIVAEVNNTPWGEQHCYVLDAKKNRGSGELHRYAESKQFHVSPFLPMEMQYDWRFSFPGGKLSTYMQNFQDEKKIFDATLILDRKPITHAQLASVLLRFPFMTVKVVLAIYYQALRLLLKRTPIFDHPSNKEAPTSVKSS